MSPENKQLNEKIEDQQIVYISIGIVLVVIIASIVVYGIGYGQNSQATSYENKIESVEKQVDQLSDAETQALALGVAEEEINSIYSRQKTYSQLIADLSKYAIKGIKLTNVSMDSSDLLLQIQGIAKNYLMVNKQVVAYQQSEQIDNTQIISAVNDSSGKVVFSLQAVVK